MPNLKMQLIGTLLMYGARNAKISRKQEMKLKEYVLPYLTEELSLGGYGPMKIQDIRKFIDSWEASDLNETDYKYYYVKKNSDGKSLWDLF